MGTRRLEEMESCDSETDLLQLEDSEELSAGRLESSVSSGDLRPWRKVLTMAGMAAAGGLLVCFAFYQVAGSRKSSESAFPAARVEASISPSRFLKSDELMGVVADHWTLNNPQCLRNGNELPAFCRSEVLQPALAEAMRAQVDRRLERTPELGRVLSDIHMNEDDQEKVMGAVSHVFDPLMASIYKDASGVMHEHAASGPEVLYQKMKEKLQPREMEVRQLRKKLLPDVEGVSDASTFRPYLNEHSVGFSGESNGWSLRLDVSGADNGAAATLWPGRQLAAPVPPVAPAATVATVLPVVVATVPPVAYVTIPPPVYVTVATTTTTPKPPTSIAAEVVASLDIPFSHLIVSILASKGKLFLPKWLKIVMTIEDVFLVNPINLIVDSILIFKDGRRAVDVDPLLD